jgi:vacuolar fusion protein MON1
VGSEQQPVKGAIPLPFLPHTVQSRPSCLDLAMDPNPNPSDSLPHERLAALSLRRDLPPDFAGAEIDNDAEAKADDDEEEDEGYLTAVSRGDSSTCAAAAWREAAEGLEEDISPSSPSSSGYAGERGSSLASSAGIEEPDPEPDGVGVQDWARDKKHLDEVQIRGQVTSSKFGPYYGFPDFNCTFSAVATSLGCPELMFQDDASASWRKRKKHFFILSNSGKPIYSRLKKSNSNSQYLVSFQPGTVHSLLSRREDMTCYLTFRYGDEHKLAGFSATLQAIISFVENRCVLAHTIHLTSLFLLFFDDELFDLIFLLI